MKTNSQQLKSENFTLLKAKKKFSKNCTFLYKHCILAIAITSLQFMNAQVSNDSGSNRHMYDFNYDRGSSITKVGMLSSSSNNDRSIWNSSGLFKIGLGFGNNFVNQFVIKTNGNVGIGVLDPQRTFHVRGSGSVMRIDRDDTNPGLLFVKMNSGFTTTEESWFIGGGGTSNIGDFIIRDMGTAVGGNGIGDRLKIKPSGNVEITKTLTVGTSNIINGTIAHFDGRVYISENDGSEEPLPSSTSDEYGNFLLWVEEGIVSNDLAILESSEWPDYVFDEGYNLPTLDNVASFVKENGHLHNMPSAEEVESKGFTVSDMTKRIVQTVEELTLYTIEQEKKIKAQMFVIEELTARLTILERKNN
jgi:hypothetical protein